MKLESMSAIFVEAQRRSGGALVIVSTMFHSPKSLTILFATETGNALALAAWASKYAETRGLRARLVDMATYNTTRFTSERDLLILTSTYGEGEPPYTASDFFDFLDESTIQLVGVRFAVLALGDSGYDDFCQAGKRVDSRLQALGATRLVPRRDSDIGEKKQDHEWLAAAVEIFVRSANADPALALHCV